MSAGGEGVAEVRLIMNLRIVSKLDTTMLLPNKFGAHHNGSWGELSGDTILDRGRSKPKDEKVYQFQNNQLVQAI